MSYAIGNENLLHELACTLAAAGDHATAIALRKLARAGYTTLEQVDGVLDWILLSIPGIGVKRLAAVRALTRPEWQPPSQQAIQVAAWYLSAVRFALRFWPPDTLASVIRSLEPTVCAAGSIEARLAMDIFVQAIYGALAYCRVEELDELLLFAGNGHLRRHQQGSIAIYRHKPQVKVGENGRKDASGVVLLSSVTGPRPTSQESSHYAYPHQKRREIVQRYRAARDNGGIENKDQWARAQYGISGKTLLSYEREFPERVPGT